MAQPLSTEITADPHVQVHLAGGMPERPRLAVALAEAVQAFTVCESAVGLLYLALNAGRPESAFDELRKTVEYRGRAKMVRKKAAKLANPADRALVFASVDKADRAAKMAKSVSHGLWGHCSALPNAVVFRPTQEDLFGLAQQLNKRLGKPSTQTRGDAGVLVFTIEDFEEVASAAIEATATLEMTSSYLILDDDEEKNRVLAQILSDPQTVSSFRKQLAQK